MVCVLQNTWYSVTRREGAVVYGIAIVCVVARLKVARLSKSLAKGGGSETKCQKIFQDNKTFCLSHYLDTIYANIKIRYIFLQTIIIYHNFVF